MSNYSRTISDETRREVEAILRKAKLEWEAAQPEEKAMKQAALEKRRRQIQIFGRWQAQAYNKPTDS